MDCFKNEVANQLIVLKMYSCITPSSVQNLGAFLVLRALARFRRQTFADTYFITSWIRYKWTTQNNFFSVSPPPYFHNITTYFNFPFVNHLTCSTAARPMTEPEWTPNQTCESGSPCPCPWCMSSWWRRQSGRDASACSMCFGCTRRRSFGDEHARHSTWRKRRGIEIFFGSEAAFIGIFQ